MDEISGGSGTHLGSAVAHCAERIGTFSRSVDRERAEAELTAPERLKEQQRIQREREAEHAAKRTADRLARECQDKIDVLNKTLIITPDGYRFRKSIITSKWEPDQIY